MGPAAFNGPRLLASARLTFLAVGVGRSIGLPAVVFGPATAVDGGCARIGAAALGH